jgi:hypothetical protein
MHTVLYISPMTLGSEVPVRQLHARFPVAALDRGAGMGRLVAFQEQFHRFLATPEIASFFQELSAHVEHLPLTAEGTAAMPLATQMLLWQRDDGA